MSKSLSTITRGIAALALSVAGLAVFTGVAGAADVTGTKANTATVTLAGTVTTATVGVPIVITATDSDNTNVQPVNFTTYESQSAVSITNCSAVTAVAGVATCTWTPTAAGNVYLAATFSGTYASGTPGNLNAASTGGALTVTVKTAPVTLVTATQVAGLAGSAVVSWVNPSVTTSVDHYTVTSSPSTGVTGCSTTSATPGTASAANAGCTVTGLTVGTPYTFSVVSSPTGTSFASAPAPTSLTTTNVVTVSGPGSATVHFTSDGTNKYFVATSTPTGGTCSVNLAAAGTTGVEQSCIVTGLTSGVSYQFKIASFADSAAPSAASTSGFTNAVVPSAATNAPTIGTATDIYGTGVVKVNFTAPTNNGVAVTGYQVTTTSSPLTWSVLCTTSDPLASSCSYTPATARAGNVYVEALSVGGPSAASGAVALAAPAAPTGTPVATQSGGNTTVTLPASTTISAAQDTYLANTKWTVLYGVNTVCTATATATSCTFSNSTAGLTTGAAASFTIKAYNAAGGTADVTPSNTIIVGTAPAAFTATATVNNAKGRVEISPAAATGYTYYDASATHALTCTLITASTCGILIDANPANNGTALASGKLPSNYLGVIVVAATNTASLTTYVATNQVGPLSFPAAPTSATLQVDTPALGTLTASWTTVANAINYIVQLQTCTTNVATATNTTCVASGSPKVVTQNANPSTTFSETPGLFYDFTVQAVSAAGASAVAYPSAPLQASLSAPSGVKVKLTNATNSTVTATWTAPTGTGG